MQRPFHIHFEAVGPPDALEVVLDFQAAVSDTGKEQGIQEVMDSFARLTARGALAGDTTDPAEAAMVLADTRLAGQQGYWMFHEARFDPGGVCVLLNMIHYVHLEDTPVKAARIYSPRLRNISDLMAVRFPQRWPRLAFELEIGDLLDDVDVAVRFRHPQDELTIKRVVDTMAVWLLASHRGAYADDSFNPSKTAVLLGPDVMDLSSERIIWFIDVLRCNESALDGLINLLHWVHHKITPLSRVEIGP
jgi:hypothetical protein